MKIKSRKDIVADTIIWMRNSQNAITDFNPGSVIRSIIDAVSSQLAQIYYDTQRRYRNKHIMYANGSDLDVVVAERSIKRKPATKSSVVIQLTGLDGTTYPLGNKVATKQGTEFVTVEEKSIVGQSVDIAAEAVVAGESGNVKQGTITEIIDPVENITEVTNPNSAAGGYNQENDTILRNRAITLLSTLSQGIQASYDAWAKEANDDIFGARAQANHPSYSRSTVVVHLVKNNGGIFTQPELDTITSYIQTRMPLGFYAKCINMVWETITVSAQIRRDVTYSLVEVQNNIIDNLQKYLDYREWEWGQDVEWSDIYSLVNSTIGVDDLSTSQFAPSANTILNDYTLPKLGSVTVVEW